MNYGETTIDSWLDVLAALGPFRASSGSETAGGVCDRFVDLGSGRGTLVLASALALPGLDCVGVELSKKRHNMAVCGAYQLHISPWVSLGNRDY